VIGKTFTAAFESNGGSAADSIRVASGSLLPLPNIPTRSGYIFAGWYKDAGLTLEWNFNTDTVTEDITLYAKWTQGVPQTFTVAFESNGGSAVGSVNVQGGSLLARPVNPVKSGYIFAGWFKNAESTEEWKFALDVVTANITLYAKWTEVAYYVSPVATSTDWAAARNINTPCIVAIAMANAMAGDTVYFLEGTYITSGGTHYHATWEPAHSGTAGAPITFAAYPGAKVIIEGICPGAMTNDINSPTMVRVFSTGNKDYITFDGFIIRANDGAGVDKIGSIIIGYDTNSWDNTSDYCIVRNCVIDGGTNKMIGGNLEEGVRIERAKHTLVSNCVIKNIRGIPDAANKSGIKMYDTKYTIIENCEFFNCSVGIYDKRDGESSIYRNNYIHGYSKYGIHVTSYRKTDTWLCNHPDVTAYNNVIANNIEFAYYEEATSDSCADRETLYNNTFYNSNGPGSCVQMFGGTGKRFFNNIIQSKRLDNYYGVLKFFVPTNTLSVPVEIAECDYNQYGNLDFLIRSKLRYTGNPTPTIDYSTFSAWQDSGALSDGGNPDVHGLASDPMFENASGTMLKLDDFRLAQSSPCLGAGKNGVNMGADIDGVGPNLPEYKRRTVIFREDDVNSYNNNYQSAIVTDVEHGSFLTKPADPVKAGYTFAGWYTDRALAIEWDFASNPVEVNMALFAKWVVEPASVTITEDSITMEVGGARTLTATVLPANADNKVVEWTSSDTSVATVSANGAVTAISDGTATITARVVGTEITDTCTVTVLSAGIRITGPSVVDGLAPFNMYYGLEDVADITAQKVVISYDKDRFDFVSAESIKVGITVLEMAPNTDAGTVTMLLASLGDGYAITANNITGKVDILELEFSPKTAGTGMIAISASLADSTGKELLAAGTGISVEVLGKAALISAINTVQGIYDSAEEGVLPGTYPAGTKDRLNNAIAATIGVRDDGSSTGAQVLQAVADLNAAVAKFQSLIITAATGDINNSGGITVGDLAMISAKYGKTSADPGWDDIKYWDINDDGEIGLYELAFIARRIILN